MTGGEVMESTADNLGAGAEQSVQGRLGKVKEGARAGSQLAQTPRSW